MATSLNSAGASHARSLVAAGKVNRGTWTFTAADGNKLLGPNGDDWSAFGSYHLGLHTDQPEKTKGRYGYPFGKGGQVYRNALISAKGRAAQQGVDAIVNLCTELLDKIDPPKKGAMEIDRMWARLEIKSLVDDPSGEMTIEGIASTPTTDRQGDIVMPEGAQFSLPLPFLYQHNSKQPIGSVVAVKTSKAGIWFRAVIAKAGLLPFIDEARTLIKAGLLKGTSIGFRSKESEPINPKDPFFGGIKFLLWEWLELSAVTIPANAEATIQAIKSLDKELLARQQVLSDQESSVRKPRPSIHVAAVAESKSITKGNKMTLKEQLAAWEAKRAAAAAAMKQMMDKTGEDGVTLTPEEASEYDELEQQVEQIDAHLKRLRKQERLETEAVKAALPVTADAGTSESKSLAVRRGDAIMLPNANVPKGMGFARYVKALAFAKGQIPLAIQYAEQQKHWQTETPDVMDGLKAAVAAGTTADSAWAGPLVYNQNLVTEFVELLRPATIIGRMTGFRQVPFNVRYPTQTAGSTVGWVGQGLGKPVSKLQLSSGSLGFAKAAGIIVITQELARFSSPSAELLVRNDLVSQMTQFLDAQFIDPGVAAVANVSPASVLNGSSNIVQATATWSSTTNIETDVKTFLSAFANNEIALDGSTYWVMTPATALALSMIRTTNGPAAYPDISINGGTWFGIPVITSNGVPHSVSAGQIVALVKASEVFLADDGATAIDASQEASLQMDSAPTQDATTPTASTMVSMWQTNSIAIRCERIINWSRRRGYGCGYLDNVHTS